MNVRRFGVAVLAVGLCALGIGSVPASAAGTTTVNLRVYGCNGCKVHPVTSLLPPTGYQLTVFWDGPEVVVRGGKASFQIPTDYTRGMALVIQAPVKNGPYDGLSGGTAVALSKPRPVPGISKDIDHIEDCWTGTTESSATLRIRVVRKKWTGGYPEATFVLPVGYLTSLPMPKQVRALDNYPLCPA